MFFKAWIVQHFSSYETLRGSGEADRFLLIKTDLNTQNKIKKYRIYVCIYIYIYIYITIFVIDCSTKKISYA